MYRLGFAEDLLKYADERGECVAQLCGKPCCDICWDFQSFAFQLNIERLQRNSIDGKIL